MNLVEVYIIKIYSHQTHHFEWGIVHELVVDTDCYGRKESRRTIHVSEYDYKMIKEKGYYLA